MKEYSTLPRILKMEPYYQVQFSVITRISVVSSVLALSKRYMQGIQKNPDKVAFFNYIIYSEWFGLVWFYGTSTIVGYFMPNQFSYMKQLYFKHFNLS